MDKASLWVCLVERGKQGNPLCAPVPEEMAGEVRAAVAASQGRGAGVSGLVAVLAGIGGAWVEQPGGPR